MGEVARTFLSESEALELHVIQRRESIVGLMLIHSRYVGTMTVIFK